MAKQAHILPSFALIIFIVVCFIYMLVVLNYNFGLETLSFRINNVSSPFGNNNSVRMKLNNNTKYKADTIHTRISQFGVSNNVRFRNNNNGLQQNMSIKTGNQVLEINEKLKRLLASGSNLEIMNQCNLTNRGRFLVISPPIGRLGNLMFQFITKTCPCNEHPFTSHFYIVKLGFTGVYLFFLIFAPKHRLWVLVRTA